MIGTPYALERCEELAEKFGPRFEPPALLREMAEKNQSFYGRFAPEAQKAA
jgi:3-hydroxyacyl-CoA dehydrogenase/enoyl-CoA hydratase/3-hydroxybutyryl-CoA epimerase